MPRKHVGQHQTQELRIGFGEERLSLWCEGVSARRLAAARAATVLLYQPIALQGHEVDADGIARETERLGQLVDGATGTAEEDDNPPAGAGQKPFSPAARLHAPFPPYSS